MALGKKSKLLTMNSRIPHDVCPVGHSRWMGVRVCSTLLLAVHRILMLC